MEGNCYSTYDLQYLIIHKQKTKYQLSTSHQFHLLLFISSYMSCSTGSFLSILNFKNLSFPLYFPTSYFLSCLYILYPASRLEPHVEHFYIISLPAYNCSHLCSYNMPHSRHSSSIIFFFVKHLIYLYSIFFFLHKTFCFYFL